MKSTIILLLILTMGTYVNAQALDTVLIVQKARKFKLREHILIMFEILDTVDAAGKNITMSRSYYFDKQRRKVSSIRESYNPKKTENGIQVIYSFSENKMTSVKVIPSRLTCRNCESHYFFLNDTLSSKTVNHFTTANSEIFVRQSQLFQSKIASELPWGYFENEVIVNGQGKKPGKSYR